MKKKLFEKIYLRNHHQWCIPANSPGLLSSSGYDTSYEVFGALIWNLSNFSFGFLGIFACISSLRNIILPLQSEKQIVMVFTSCKTSYNVLSHSHVLNQGLDQIVLIRRSGLGAKVRGVFVDIWGGGDNAKESLYLKHPFAELVSWNFLTRTNENYHYIRWELSLRVGLNGKTTFTMGMWETGVVNAKVFINKKPKFWCFDHNIVIK